MRDKTIDQQVQNLKELQHEQRRQLEQHIDQQIGQIREALQAQQREADQRFEAQREAIAKAEQAAEKRFESVNEFRAQLADQARTFLPRETFDQVVAAWTTWRENTDKRLNEQYGQGRERDAANSRRIQLSIAAIGFFITIVVVVVNLLLA